MTQLPKDPAVRARLTKILEDRAYATSWRCDLPTCDGKPHDGKPKHARTEQRPPWGRTLELEDGQTVDVKRWYLRGGRGSGKTWAGSRALAELILWYGGVDEDGSRRSYGVIGPTFKYTKETLIEGDSGLIAALGGENGPYIEAYNRSTGQVLMANGAIVYTAGADNRGQGIEGKNISAIWLDEVGLWAINRWKYVWTQAIRYAVRKSPALYIITGTPKQGHPFVQELIKDERVYTAVMATKDNKENLPEDLLREWEETYGGTRIGRQELEGEVLNDVEGALWSWQQIEATRLTSPPKPSDLLQIVVGFDPAVTSTENSDEHGIVVAGQLAGDPAHYVILDDLSGRYTVLEAVQVVVEAYHKWQANSVIAEVNNGGDWIAATFRTHPTTIPVRTITASRGKRLRAEPIAALSEQGRLHMLGTHQDLEDQMTTWSPLSTSGSPDRLDAMVWAVTALHEKGVASRAFVGKHSISIRSN